MRQRAALKPFTPGEAQYVLQRLIKDRRINAAEVSRLAGEMRNEIADLERRLADLRAAAGASGGSAGVRRGAAAKRKRRPAQANPALTASRRIQGEYMGLIRQLTGRTRARIKKLASEKGREAAIKEMRAAAK